MTSETGEGRHIQGVTLRASIGQLWSALVSSGQLEPEGLRGVVSGQGTCQAGQCWSMVTRARGGEGGLNGQGMVSTCHQCDTRHQGGETGPRIGQSAQYHWSVRRSHWTTDFTNLRKLERNCDKTSCAQPGLDTFGGGQSLEKQQGWSVLMCFDMRIIINCFVFSLSASPISNILNL